MRERSADETLAFTAFYPHFPVLWQTRFDDLQLPGSARLPSGPMQF